MLKHLDRPINNQKMTNISSPESMLRETPHGSTIERNPNRTKKKKKRAGGREPYLERTASGERRRRSCGGDGGERDEAGVPRSRSPGGNDAAGRRRGGAAARGRVVPREDLGVREEVAGVRAQSRGARVHGVIGRASARL
ncbi:hypothetical protein EUGRSUZ_F01714 [Eucalyptus grandis]|uniref:Uncharacterized protein n=2 Tax=Eucalyptus grandis TaxID=71139 RepID=A0ACC3KFI8_EUCGR|nr:hypothetical protein EUGRSUZ_F01714 [Eucalyptus grandis]